MPSSVKAFLRYLAAPLFVLFALFAGIPQGRAQRGKASNVLPQSLPSVFVHGNGDDAAQWIGVIWLFQSNG